MLKRAERIAEIIKENGVEAVARVVNKNGVDKYGIVLGTGVIRPTLYVENDDDREEYVVAMGMIRQYEELPKETGMENVVEYLSKYENVKDNLMLCVTQADMPNAVTEKVLDLTKYVRVKVANDGQLATTIVTEQLIDKWKITKEQLFADVENSSEYCVKTMRDVVIDTAPEMADMIPEESFEDAQMLVVTNEDKTFGASILANIGKIKEIANEIGREIFYILPSSIHEALIVRYEYGIEDELKNMVREVNETQVEPEERLSYSIYKYENGEVTVVE